MIAKMFSSIRPLEFSFPGLTDELGLKSGDPDVLSSRINLK